MVCTYIYLKRFIYYRSWAHTSYVRTYIHIYRNVKYYTDYGTKTHIRTYIHTYVHTYVNILKKTNLHYEHKQIL